MNITISENLKLYRKNKGNTQEELAEHLGISIQAVSKWERNEGFPDITLLPQIAMYYNVSVDDLLGVGKIQIEKKVAEYLEKDDAYERKADYESIKLLWAEAFKEFPNNYTVLKKYMGLIPDERADEKIKIAERILNESDVPSHRYDVISGLVQLYTRLGNEEKAVEYAKKLPRLELSRDIMLTEIYKGAKLVEIVQENFLRDFSFVGDNQIYKMMWDGDFNNSERKKACERRLKLWEWIFEDGDYGFYNTRVARIYEDLAILDAVDENFNATDKNIDGVIKNLSLAADYEIKFVTDKSDAKRTSFLVNRTRLEAGFQGYSGTSDNACRWLINFMKRNWFDLCREDERFKEIEKKLSEYAN